MIVNGGNDAREMAKSTVEIVFWAWGFDVALETADIALMGDRLDSLPVAIAINQAE